MSRVDSFRVLFLLLIGTLAAGGCDGDKNPAGPSGLSGFKHTLTVSLSPPGGGSITKSPNLSQFASGASVTLTATPASGYQFTGWQGDASGSTNPITVKMDRNKTVTAAFAPAAPNQYTVTMSASPSDAGTIARAPDQPQYAAGTTVTLTATPAAGYVFTGWQGDATGSTNPIAVTIDKNKSVTAAFTSTAPNQYSVAISASPANGGTVTRTPDQAQYPAGTTVTLTATSAAGHQFTGWQGDATGTTNPITLTIDKNKSVTAAFTPTAPDQYTVVVSASPADGGTVTRAPNQAQYPAGTTVTLTASPAAGYRFSGWQGDASGTTNPTTLVTNTNKSVTAAFVLLVPAPSVSVPSTSRGSYSVTVTYPWTSTSPNDRMELEESSDGSWFTLVTSRSGITSPWTVPLTRSPGTYRYRARVYLAPEGPYHPTSPYSPTVSTIVEASASSTLFVNDTQDTFSIVSLKIDGVEKLFYPNEIGPQRSLEIEVAPGSHSYTTVNGYFDQTGRHDLYTRSGSYTQPVGPLTIRVTGRMLEELLTPYSWTGLCARDYWQEDLHLETYRFYSGGVFRLYRDGELAVSGTFTFRGQGFAYGTSARTVWFDVDSRAQLLVMQEGFWMDFGNDVNCGFGRSAGAPAQQANRLGHFAGEALGVAADDFSWPTPKNPGERVNTLFDEAFVFPFEHDEGRGAALCVRPAGQSRRWVVRTARRSSSIFGWQRATR